MVKGLLVSQNSTSWGFFEPGLNLSLDLAIFRDGTGAWRQGEPLPGSI